MVLDAAFEPSGDSEFDQWATQLVGFEHAFNDWAAWCEEGNDCAFNAVDVGARWDALFDSLDANPLTAADGRSRQPGRARDGDDRGDVQQGRVAGARLGARRRRGRRRHRPARPRRQLQPAQPGRHLRHDPPVGPGHPLRQRPRADVPGRSGRAARPDQGGGAALRPHDAHRGLRRRLHGDHPRPPEARTPRRTPAPRRSSSSAGTNDPATPIRWAEELTAEMGPSATLLTYSGEGHGAILSSTCVDEAEAATIRDLTLPAAGTACAPDPDVPRPAYWDQLPVPEGVGAPIDDPALAGALGLTPSQAYSGAWALTGDAQTVATEYQQALPSIGVQTADAGRQRRGAGRAGAVARRQPGGGGHLLGRRAGERRHPRRRAASTCRPARASCWCSPTRPRADPPCGGAPCSSWWGSRWPRHTSCSRARRRSSSRWPRRPAPPGRRPISRAARERPATPR